MLDWQDRMFAFDYDSSGKINRLVAYRRGNGAIFILKNDPGNKSFVPVYMEGRPRNGIGGYGIKSDMDTVFAFDWNHSGHADHLVFYTPSEKGFAGVGRTESGWSTVFSSDEGVGGSSLDNSTDAITPFGYLGSGSMDTLVVSRREADKWPVLFWSILRCWA